MSRKIRSAFVAIAAIAALGLTSCAADSSAEVAPEDGSLGTLKVGALQTPAGDILEYITDAAAEDGLTIEFVPFTDYNTPNTALADGSVDANLFQNVVFLNTFNKNAGEDLVSVGQAYLPSAAFYSEKIESLDDLADGATVAIPNDTTNGGRALELLASAGLIEVEDGVTGPAGVTANPKNLKFKEIENATLPQALPDVDTAFITSSFALPAGLTAEDGIFVEGEDSKYYNVLATRPELKDDARIVALYDLLTAQSTADFITKEWSGLIVPVVR